MDFARRRRVHQVMVAETVGEKDPLNLGCRSDNGMMIRRSFIQTGRQRCELTCASA